MDTTRPTTSPAVLRMADAFHEVWSRGRDVLQALEHVQADIREAEQQLAQLRARYAEVAAETARLETPLATLKQMRAAVGLPG